MYVVSRFVSVVVAIDGMFCLLQVEAFCSHHEIEVPRTQREHAWFFGSTVDRTRTNIARVGMQCVLVDDD